MCETCGHSPCHPRCPNAPEPPIIHSCIHCDAAIYDGDDYYDIDGEPWCEDCIQNSRTTA